MAPKGKEKNAPQVASMTKRAEEHDTGYLSSYLRIPEGTKIISFEKPGIYRWDVIPYKVGKRNPAVSKHGWCKEGALYPEMTFWIHRRIGPAEETVICPRKTFGKACPICEDAAEQRRDPKHDKELVKTLNPTEHQLWNVIDADDPDVGIQLFTYNTYFFGNILDTKTRNQDSGDNYHLYHHPSKGFTLKITVEKDDFPGGTWNKVKDIEFKPRKEQYDFSICDDAVSLENVPKELSFESLKKLYLHAEPAEDSDDEEDEPKKKPKSKKPARDEDEDDEEPEEEEDEDTDDGDEESETEWSKGDKVSFIYKGKRRNGKITKLNPRRKLAHVTCPDRDGPYIVDLEDLQPPKQAEETKKPKSKKPPKDEDEDEPEDDEDSEDEDTDDEDEPSEEDEEEWEEPEDEDEDDEPPAKAKKRKK